VAVACRVEALRVRAAVGAQLQLAGAAAAAESTAPEVEALATVPAMETARLIEQADALPKHRRH
jgi:hypothetical protein